MEARAETTSRNSVLKRGALSEWRPKRKPRPGIQPQCGTPFPVETACLDIFLRSLLQGVDRFVHVEQVSHGTDDKEHRQITKVEDFAANKDRREQNRRQRKAHNGDARIGVGEQPRRKGLGVGKALGKSSTYHAKRDAQHRKPSKTGEVKRV